MNWRSTAVSIIAILLVTWLLISAITVVQPVQGGSGGNGGSLGSGTGSGGGNGGGTGLGNGNGNGLGLNLPNFPINFHLPPLSFKVPFNIPIINFSFPDPFHFVFPPLNLSLFGGSHPSTPGGGGHSGTGKGPQNTPKQNPIVPILLNPIFLIIIIIAVSAVLVVLLLTNRQRLRPALIMGRPAMERPEQKMEKQESVIPVIEEREREGEKVQIKYAIPYFEIKSIEGISLPVERDLPPLWQFSDSMEMKIFDSHLKITLNQESINISSGHISFKLEEGLNRMVISNESGKSQTIDMVGNIYSEDVRDVMLANLGRKILEEMNGKTLREILNDEKMKEYLDNREASKRIALIFEKVFYGKKTIKREEYEIFLRGVRESFRNPLIVWRKYEQG